MIIGWSIITRNINQLTTAKIKEKKQENPINAIQDIRADHETDIHASDSETGYGGDQLCKKGK